MPVARVAAQIAVVLLVDRLALVLAAVLVKRGGSISFLVLLGAAVKKSSTSCALAYMTTVVF